MRVYLINRPFSIGTYPKEYAFSDVVDFESRRPCEELGGRMAWGYIDFVNDVPEEVLDRYELIAVESSSQKGYIG